MLDENVRRAYVKTCSSCYKEKAYESFFKRKASPDGLAYVCKECDLKRSKKNREDNILEFKTREKQWRDSNKKRISDTKRKSKYGLTSEQQDTMLHRQNGACAICKTPEAGLRRRLAIDHDHVTLENRGLLCDNCNRCLGLLKDNVDILKSAAEYLIKHKK